MRKITSSLFYQKTRVWFVWMAFILLLFSLTRLMKSLDLINKWGASWGDIFMELGFFFFLTLIEVLVVSALLAGIQLGFEKAFHKNFDIIVQIILTCGLIIPFVNLALSIFHIPAI